MVTWQRKRKPETCQLCHKAPPTWIVLDSKVHTYHELETGESRRQRDGYLVCTTCKDQIRRYNTGKRKRELRFVRWEKG